MVFRFIIDNFCIDILIRYLNILFVNAEIQTSTAYCLLFLSWSHFMIIFQEEQGRECSDSFPAASFQSNILPITSWSASFQSNISPTSSSATFQGIISK